MRTAWLLRTRTPETQESVRCAEEVYACEFLGTAGGGEQQLCTAAADSLYLWDLISGRLLQRCPGAVGGKRDADGTPRATGLIRTFSCCALDKEPRRSEAKDSLSGGPRTEKDVRSKPVKF